MNKNRKQVTCFPHKYLRILVTISKGWERGIRSKHLKQKDKIQKEKLNSAACISGCKVITTAAVPSLSASHYDGQGLNF